MFSRQNTRRGFLAQGLLGTLGLAFSPNLARSLAAAQIEAKAKRCIVIWLNGGPSHIDTFDPKPGQETNGPFEAIDTAVSGIQICEHLPKLAQQMDKLAIVRSLNSNEADHDRANQFIHTGNLPQESVDYPGFGSVLARRWSQAESLLPNFVSIYGQSTGPGFLGIDYAPYVIGDPAAPFANINTPDGVTAKRVAMRDHALSAFQKESAGRLAPGFVSDQERLATRVKSLMKSPAIAKLDLSKERPEIMERYNAVGEPGFFGLACILARKLLEQDVRCVEVVLDGWDTHADNFNAHKGLMERLDPSLSTLIADLDERGMLEATLVVCVGEFGRTPKINGDNGRDHHSEVFSALFAGGGIRGGQVYGSSDETGTEVKDKPVTIPDLFATMLSAFGIDGTKSITTPEGRPIKLAEKGKVIQDLFG